MIFHWRNMKMKTRHFSLIIWKNTYEQVSGPYYIYCFFWNQNRKGNGFWHSFFRREWNILPKIECFLVFRYENTQWMNISWNKQSRQKRSVVICRKNIIYLRQIHYLYVVNLSQIIYHLFCRWYDQPLYRILDMF